MRMFPLGGARRYGAGRCPFCDRRVNDAGGGIGQLAHRACLRDFNAQAHTELARDDEDQADDDDAGTA